MSIYYYYYFLNMENLLFKKNIDHSIIYSSKKLEEKY